LSSDDDAIVINSFSKYYCMTGWRIGWMIAPERLVRPMECLAQNLFISPPAISQHAALAAFEASDELDARREVYAQNRELLLDELPRLGFTDFAPVDGAFYIYTNVSRYSNDSLEFARAMLREARVAATPGADFDTSNGGHYLRFSFAGSHADMVEAVRRLRAWLTEDRRQ
jgi:aspartate/methionine/tyrosine aminotransferase